MLCPRLNGKTTYKLACIPSTVTYMYLQLFKKVLQLNCKTQLMERDALNQQHVTQCYAIALIKSRRSLLVVGKTTG